jgi:hypothetical protein
MAPEIIGLLSVGGGLVVVGILWFLLANFIFLRILLAALVGALLGGLAGYYLPWLLLNAPAWFNAPAPAAPTDEFTVRALCCGLGVASGASVWSIAVATSALFRALSAPVTVAASSGSRSSTAASVGGSPAGNPFG